MGRSAVGRTKMSVSRLARGLCVVAFLLIATTMTAGQPARGDVAFACPLGAVRQSAAPFNSLAVDLEWTAGGVRHAAPLGMLWLFGQNQQFDLDGDGVSDVDVGIGVDTGWWVHQHDAGSIFGDSASTTWRNNAINSMMTWAPHMVDLIRDRFGVDYEALLDHTVSRPGWNPVAIPAFPTLPEYFRQVNLWAKVIDLNGTAPAADIEMVVTLGRSDATEDRYVVRVGAGDASAAVGEPAWARSTLVDFFVDVGFSELAAVGTRTENEARSVVATDSLRVGVDVEQMSNVPVHVGAALDVTDTPHLEPAGAGTVGNPGGLALAMMLDCNVDPGLLLPEVRNELTLGYDSGSAGGGAPETLRIQAHASADPDGDGSFDRTTFHADGNLARPPRAVDLRFASRGDPAAGDAVDIDGDGVYDAYADDSITIDHTGERPASLTFALEQNPVPTGFDEPFYMAMAAHGLPSHVEVDMTSENLAAVDTDGDGTADSTSADMGTVDARSCDGRWGSPACDASMSPVADMSLAVGNDVPAKTPEGRLPAVFDAIAATPADITDTADGHFEPAPDDRVMYRSDEASGLWQVTVKAHEVAHMVYADLDPDPLRQVVRAGGDLGGGRQLGLGIDMTTAAGRNTRMWGTLALMPHHFEVTADLQPAPVDGDPVELDWRVSGRTAAAFAVEMDGGVPANYLRAAAWLGTGDGSTDGLSQNVEVDVEVDAATKGVTMTASDPMAAIAGATFASAADRASGMRTRILARAWIPQHLSFRARTNGATLESVNADTCGGGGCTPVNGIRATVVRDRGSSGDSALTGIAALEVPEPGVFGAFPSDVGDHIQAVSRGGFTDPGATWSVGLALAELTAATYTHSEPAEFSRTEVCLDARSAGPFGVGYYGDTGDGTAATWIDGTLEDTADPARGVDLGMTAVVNTPLDTDPAQPGGTIGGLTPAQEQAVAGDPGAYDLLRYTRSGCRVASSSSGPKGDVRLDVRARAGRADAVAYTVGNERNPVDAAGGADFAVEGAFASMPEGETTLGGLDIEAALPLADSIAVEQPRLQSCPGNLDPATCHEARSYDAAPWQQTHFAWHATDWNVPTPVPLRLEYIYEAAGREVDLADGRAVHFLGDISRLPADMTVDARIDNVLRDSRYDVDATITDHSGTPLPAVAAELWDDLRPAAIGDALERAPGGPAQHPENQHVANMSARLTGLGSTLNLQADVLLPRHGFTPRGMRAVIQAGNLVPAEYAGVDDYAAASCGRFPNPTQGDHVFDTLGQDPSDWEPSGARDPEGPAARAPYVHAELELGGATKVALEGQLRQRQVSGANFLNPHTPAATVRLDADAPASGRVRGVYPNLTLGLHDGAAGAGVDVCADVDVPLDLTLRGVSRFSVGVDLIKATLTVDQQAFNGGGSVELAFREMAKVGPAHWSSLGGVWAHELISALRPPLKRWYTRIVDNRMEPTFVDPGNVQRNRGNLPTGTFRFDNRTFTRWTRDQASSVDASAEWVSLFVNPLLHPAVANELSDQVTPLRAWDLVFNNLARTTQTLADSALVAGQNPFTMPELDHGATRRDHTAQRIVLKSVCGFRDNRPIGTMASLDDGTTFALEATWGAGGRLRLMLVGRYANGQVRFVTDIHQADYSAVALCNSYHLDLSITTRADGTARVRIPIERSTGGPYSLVDTVDVVTDASGNWWRVADTLSVVPQAPSAGAAVTLTGGEDRTSVLWNECVWLPGDGSRAVSNSDSLAHTYAFPGEYTAAQLCYDLSHVLVRPGGDGNDVLRSTADAVQLRFRVT